LCKTGTAGVTTFAAPVFFCLISVFLQLFRKKEVAAQRNMEEFGESVKAFCFCSEKG